MVPALNLLAQLLAGLPAVRAVPAPQAGAVACSSGVHIIAARGTSEFIGQGSLAKAIETVQTQYPGSDVEMVENTLSLLSSWGSLVQKGITAMTNQAKAYATKCPSTQIVLMGYSQGAQVAMDTVCGASSAGITTTPLDKATLGQITAVVVFSDPTRVNGASYNKGTSTGSGSYARTKPCSADVAAKAISFCDKGDPDCDKGLNILAQMGVVTKYASDAKNFIVGSIDQWCSARTSL